MPQLPLMKGTRTTKDARYLDALPVNMVPTTAQTDSANGYMLSFPGIKTYFNCNGASFGAHYNSAIGKEFRVLGKELYEDTKKVADIVGDKLTNICHSPNSTAFVDDQKVKYFRDEIVTELKNWAEGEYAKDSDPSNYDLSGVIDMDRHEGRYVWINKNRLGCTALAGGIGGDPNTSPEQRPDYVAPFYATEADPDDNKAVRSWQGKFIAVFGRNVCQWFGLTGNAKSIYASQKSMQTQFGIVSTHAVCRYKGNFAALGSEKDGTLQIAMVAPGSYQKISTPTIDRIINSYKESELQDVLLDAFLKDGQDFLMVTLPNQTFVYEANQGVWFQLKSGIEVDNKYSGRHVVYNHEEGLTIGDSGLGRVGKLDESISSQNGLDTEMIVYTPFLRVNNGKGAVPLFDLEFESIFGHVNQFQSVFISTTLDGRSYGNEYRLQYNDVRQYLNRAFISNVGRVNESIGFKLRVVSKETVNLSSFKVRVGYGN